MSDANPRDELIVALKDASRTLKANTERSDQGIGQFLEFFATVMKDADEGAGYAPSALAFIGTALNEPGYYHPFPSSENRLYKVGDHEKGPTWAAEFAREWLSSAREALCGKKGIASEKSAKMIARSAAVTLSTGLVAAFGVSSAVATGVATLFILTLLDVTKQAFCAATDEQVLEKLKSGERRPGRRGKS